MQWKDDPADSILLNRSFSPAMQWLNCELMDTLILSTSRFLKWAAMLLKKRCGEYGAV
ncbi:MAG: hypothetical protein WAU60_12955 [Candidatus Competibacter denitrificans]